MKSKIAVFRIASLGKVLLGLLCTHLNVFAQESSLGELPLEIGILPTGKWNAITDVEGVRVGQVSINEGTKIRTGVTAILPHGGNLYQEKVPAAMYIGNGYGKLMGYSQVEELGNIETPIVLTNTLSVPMAAQALIQYSLDQPGNESVRSVNPIVGETNDGRLNDIRGLHVQPSHVLSAIAKAGSGPVEEGAVGAGTGTICFGFKGGIGSASRILPEELGGYTIGVLVQSNFGGVLEMNGIPVGKLLGQYYLDKVLPARDSADGSIMIVVATDAPVDARNLKRMAKRAMLGLAKTGGIASNGSGDYVIAFSTYKANRIISSTDLSTYTPDILHNSHMSPLFLATIEATEEAILHSLIAASEYDQAGVKGLPIKQVKEIFDRYLKVEE